MSVFDMPPILQGTPEQQISALRNFLVRLADTLQAEIGDDKINEAVKQATTAAAVGSGSAAKAEIDKNAQNLRQLITKTADSIYSYVDEITQNLSSVYVAKSEFGTYQETVNTTIQQTAKQTVESYDFQSQIDAVNSRADSTDRFVTTIRGEIRRGLITDPETGETQMGIAISENLTFTGETEEENGLTYYKLAPGQTLGLYTATGWQFWINGSKRGWFDSEDGMLHVANIVVEDKLQIGDGWLMTTTGGFGLRYTGG